MQTADTTITQNSYELIKNLVAKSLAVFWIFDGLLQLQPKMFGQGFITNVLAPNLNNQPEFLHALVAFGIKLFSLNQLFTNTAATIVQLAIGILLLFPLTSKKFKIGLYVSIIWGLIVWIFGEGMGNLLTGSASFYTGAPGSVLIYILLAIFFLIPNSKKIKADFLLKTAGIIFIVFAAFQFQPIFWTTGGIQSLFQGSSTDIVHSIDNFPITISNISSIYPVLFNSILIIIPVLLGLLLMLKSNRVVAGIAILFLFFIWWIGQDFGNLTTVITGVSTDPNTAPLLILFIVPAFFLPEVKRSVAKNSILFRSKVIQ